MGKAKRYIITIADDDHPPLGKLCKKMIAVGVTCDVLRGVGDEIDALPVQQVRAVFAERRRGFLRSSNLDNAHA